MRIENQHTFWVKEHREHATFPGIDKDRPSKSLPGFVYYLAENGHDVTRLSVLDIGSGNGRNARYLARCGARVIGVDFVKGVVRLAQRKSRTIPNVSFEARDLAKKWPYRAKTFDVIIDCNTTICMPNPGRTTAISEARRVLKSGGLYFFYGVGPTSLVERYPGPEPNTGIFPNSGKFEKQYPLKELVETYRAFELADILESSGYGVIDGKEIAFPTWIVIFRKP